MLGHYLVVRTPVIFGAGEDRQTVGELAALWNPEHSRASANALVLQLSAMLLAVLGIVVMCLRRFVSVPLSGTIQAMLGLASEEDDVEFPKKCSTEISKVAGALEIFRNNLIEKRNLEEAEANNRALQEEEAKQRAAEEQAAVQREQEEQQRARKQAEQEAKQAKLLLSDLETVIDSAKSGDFSARIAVGDEKDDQSRVRSLVNELIVSVEEGFKSTTSVLDQLAQGNLTARMRGQFHGAFDSLQSDVNQTATKLDHAVLNVVDRALKLNQSAIELDASSRDSTQRTETSAAGLAETTATVESFASTARSAAENAVSASSHVQDILRKARQTDEIVSSAVTAMNEISEASGQIYKVINVINGISFQTNFPALNAGVEAARAGSAGQGFAVVASEVRTLASRASTAVKEIEELINKSSVQVSPGVELVGSVSQALEEMSSSINAVSELTDEISTGANTQVTSAQEISGTLFGINRTTQQNAAMNEEVVAVCAGLTDMANQLSHLVDAFEYSSPEVSDNFERHSAA